MPRPALEVARIFRHHGPEYRKSHRLSPERVAQAVRIMTRKSLQMSLQIFFEELRASVGD